MKFLLKIVFAPAIAVLAVLIWLCGLTMRTTTGVQLTFEKALIYKGFSYIS